MSDCTCDLKQLMAQGCTCGAIARYVPPGRYAIQPTVKITMGKGFRIGAKVTLSYKFGPPPGQVILTCKCGTGGVDPNTKDCVGQFQGWGWEKDGVFRLNTALNGGVYYPRYWDHEDIMTLVN